MRSATRSTRCRTIRRTQGLAPLWIATDQEGGAVSRMSPPLTRMPPIAEIVALHRDRAERLLAIRQYAARQGRDLAALGVNLNFAPVVDLNHGVHNPEDRLTRIATRAISADPAVVTEVAGLYCATLKLTGVHCTLKHFPGLGRVYEDTHKVTADLATRRARARGIGLASVPAIDGERCGLHDARPRAPHRHRRASGRPRSPMRSSKACCASTWKHDGILVTDDFSMGAVTLSREGAGAAARSRRSTPAST